MTAPERRFMETKKFLELYRIYESLLRDHGKDYYSVESSSDDLKKNQMQVMRQMRNFLSHNAGTGFLAVSNAQICLLQSLIQEERMEGDIIKNHLWTPKRASCEEGMAVKEAMSKMASLKITRMPITGDKGILGSVDIFKMAKLLCKDAGSIITKGTYGAYGKFIACMPPDAPMENVREKLGHGLVICCTKDGHADGKFLGVLNIGQAA